jgi:hypothetical protein
MAATRNPKSLRAAVEYVSQFPSIENVCGMQIPAEIGTGKVCFQT